MLQNFQRPCPAASAQLRGVYPSTGECRYIMLLATDLIRFLRFSNSPFSVPGIDLICTDIYTFIKSRMSSKFTRLTLVKKNTQIATNSHCEVSGKEARLDCAGHPPPMSHLHVEVTS